MLRRLIVLLLVPLLGAVLVACGEESDDSSSGASAPLEEIQIEGEFGEKPEVTWDGRLEAGKITSEVLEEGDGEQVGSGDQVLAHIWLGNGFTQEEAYSSYETQPQQLTVNEKQLGEPFLEGLEGRTIGSRVAVVARADEFFGETGNPQLGIGNQDAVVLVLDLMEMYTPPKPKDVPASQLPSVVEEKGDPVGLDFSGVPKPAADGELLRAVLDEGDGEPVTTDMKVTADYLGAVYGGKKPFDESFSAKPVPFELTSVVDGWTYGLEGVPVGSRVLLQIPPDLGYGGQKQPGIPADSTLYFVIDIVSAK
ncbi:FKBP-type peptidyl-prolyl cis-trans isomerase [Nocardioides coralli]|uniref:FKBP-type peptidyl-prolyl cis-trans isomerase n=1 Tax=Nocardioides coralli TaxID=2872154 RepID=UPI001CA3A0A4|nr:FKBP-type peptidyl-prolyl cis-trans isomerase [Nocardioides coralli]QZY27669.1 FKBP-type peptidyl-prolyl cis-trans isomerase [Nocardioides coralli]